MCAVILLIMLWWGVKGGAGSGRGAVYIAKLMQVHLNNNCMFASKPGNDMQFATSKKKST